MESLPDANPFPSLERDRGELERGFANAGGRGPKGSNIFISQDAGSSLRRLSGERSCSNFWIEGREKRCLPGGKGAVYLFVARKKEERERRLPVEDTPTAKKGVVE